MEQTVTLYTIGQPTSNKRYYSRKHAEMAVEAFKSKTANICSLANSKTDMAVQLDQATHNVKKLYIEDNSLKADLELLDTPEGIKLKEVDPKFIKYCLSGTATLEIVEGKAMVGDDYIPGNVHAFLVAEEDLHHYN